MSSVTILDGGMGKELERIGAPFRQPEWSAMALIEAPDFVRQAHQNFVDAGADVIITNTYAVVPFHIGSERFASDGWTLASLAGRLAREVADAAPHAVRIAGSLPPLFGSYEPHAFDPDTAPGLWQVLIDALDPWVDFWIGETIGSSAEFRTIADLLRVDDRSLWASFALSDVLADGHAVLRTGETVSDVADVAGRESDAVLFNCSQPEVITVAVPELVSALSKRGIDVPVGAYANAFPAGATEGQGYHSNERVIGRRQDLTPERYAELASQWLRDGASLVGGCCNLYPDHIAELNRRFGG